MQICPVYVRVPASSWSALRSSVIVVAAAASLATLPAVAEAQEPPGRGAGAEDARVEAEIAARGAAFSRAYVAGDSATIRDLYTADALLLPPGGIFQGVDRVVRYFAPGPRRENLTHAMESERLEVVGSMAVDVGTWSNRWRIGDGPVQEASDRYLIVWRREEDGAWRIAYDMWHRPSN